MNNFYSDEKNVQILISLLKAHGIKKVIASPGTTNISFVRSLQNDSFFEMYSCVDERSAAYMACGLAAESGEPVVISCTGATASRNYLPGLTEAYYRKIPVLAVTSTQKTTKIGHHFPQVIDRSSCPNDVVRQSVLLQLIYDEDDWWDCELKANNAILSLYRNGGGPVHINLETAYCRSFETKELPKVRSIDCFSKAVNLPVLPDGNIAIFLGSHKKMNEREIDIMEQFCELNNAIIICDHTSAYKGKYSVLHSLISSQRLADYNELKPDLLIHMGEISGEHALNKIRGKQTWRVNEDGVLRDTFHNLSCFFEFSETDFFQYYIENGNGDISNSYLHKWSNHLENLRSNMPDFPFSNIWIAQRIHKFIPKNSALHLAILNSLRAWNFFELPEGVESSSNVGGFGIDGSLSSLIGSSLANKSKLYFAVIGDLAFFYDLNSLGNRHVGNNLRILLINNGVGIEFRNFNHPGAMFGESANDFIAAGGHFGYKSSRLVKDFCETLGFEYLTASNKEEFMNNYQRFLEDKILEKPIIFEVFTNVEDESKALELITSISSTVKRKTINTVKGILGDNNIKSIKKILKR